MTNSGPGMPGVIETAPVGQRMYEFYVGQLAAHTNDPQTGECPICHVSECEMWRVGRNRTMTTHARPETPEPEPVDEPADDDPDPAPDPLPAA
jgi:hypothetical protein